MSKKITLQDVFNYGWEHYVLNDEPPATNSTGGCAYLAPNGQRCPFGGPVPDDRDDLLSLEDAADDLIAMDPNIWDEESILSLPNNELVDIQSQLHDDHTTVSGGIPGWKHTQGEREQCYRMIADEYNLSIPGE